MVERTIDGLRVFGEAGTWLVTSGAQALPNTDVPSGDWKVLLTGSTDRVSDAVVSNGFVYGLSQVLSRISISLGDRFVMSFDFMNKTLLLEKDSDES
jgi:hypothetical protein